MKINQPLIKQFIFDKFELDKVNNEIRFFYCLGEKISFVEILKLDLKSVAWDKVNNTVLDRILFNLHLIIGISYWKTYCPKKIIINSGKLNKSQANFWNKLYSVGMGEFYYKNKIDFRNLVNFPFEKVSIKPIELKLKNRSLVPIGGGKDSIVTAELLKSQKFNISLFSLKDSQIQEEVSKIIKKDRIIIERIIDKKLFELNKIAYNGHTPVSMVYSFTALLACFLYDYKYIIFSNEQSANYGNIKYLGYNVNHQYSKSLAAEKDFSNYIHKFITPSINSFSLLRPFSELKITKLFSKYKKYYPYFSSCNKNFKIKKENDQRWCGECPKCAFVFSQLAAFLSKDEVIKIFGKNLYNDKALKSLYLELLGEKNIKPFDCVGTPDEVKSAMYLTLNKGELNKDFILKHFHDKVLPKVKNIKLLAKKTLNGQGKDNMPEAFKKALKNT